ncbi:hypothetical protein BE08_33690 [Sorangium cellulosum]|uniref:Uncharacterized protein n=1 Tax=Sorangium cellulosum TaxID=56 RepID=A0A150PI46_SORCE|nr:hypothetical protein BE08_33690 [Sorangium cellulosum]
MVPACGDDSDDSTKSDEDIATAKCEAFASTWCGRAIGCLVTSGVLSGSQEAEALDTCVDVAVATARCEDAVAVRSSYDQCIDDIEAKPCSDWDVPETELSTVTPPSSCNGIILLP